MNLLCLDLEENAALDGSTAPTTPGSLTVSPIIHPEDSSVYPPAKRLRNSDSLLATQSDTTAQTTPVRNICCVGAGYVGGPTAAVIAYNNPHIQVTVVDKDETRIRRWNSRHPPIYEPGLQDILRTARDGTHQRPYTSTWHGSTRESLSNWLERKPNLFFTTDIAQCISEADIVMIAVNTPTKTRGSGAGSATDMTAFEAVTAVVAQHARPGAIIVEKSTVPCRTAQFVQDTLLLHRPNVEFEVLSNPEFLAAGTAVKDLLQPDRILIGSSPTPAGRRAAAALASVYASFSPSPRIITINLFSSELAKLVANSMLAQRISSINSIAAVCEATGADVDEVATAIGADPRIGSKFLKAGIGFGGSCFKKDILSLVYLANSLRLPQVADYWRAVIAMNEFARDRFSSRVIRCLNNTLVGKKLTVLGYAFKKNTNDTRESPAVDIIRTLVEEGPREVAIFDPCCIPAHVTEEIGRLLGTDVLKENGGPVTVYTDVYEACDNSDAILITTEFDEFKNSGELAGAEEPSPSEQSETEYDNEEDLEDIREIMGDHDIRPFLPYVDKPSDRFKPMPRCNDSCPDCERHSIRRASRDGHGQAQGQISKGPLQWLKIHDLMRQPRWIFDGRRVLDVPLMEAMGFRVESVGRQSLFKA
ncbi:UDP-glucose 6-dehydrogenase [Bombardia bombarda]|uniref:UDP-glucose 6-dehydrogenase n=1 Tax=Bombardia bombarda TaxID=252184 RepID=A0AA39WUM5_9PEZI|nr:UDP-glucose 6-dehydrogenase [Bombardia bombarda]